MSTGRQKGGRGHTSHTRRRPHKQAEEAQPEANAEANATYASQIVQDVQAGTHDRRVTVAQRLAELATEVGHGRGLDLVEAMQHHDGLLAHDLTVVRQQLHHLRKHRGDHVDGEQLASRHEGCARDQHVAALHVLVQAVDQHHAELVVG